MNNKKNHEKGGQGAPLLFLYEVSIVVLIDFIVILLTPGIFLIQIVNTNMYLIHFYSKNTDFFSFIVHSPTFTISNLKFILLLEFPS